MSCAPPSAVPTPDRLLVVAQALRHGMPPAEIYEACGIDPWFIARIGEILDLEAKVRAHGLPGDAANLRMLKAAGFSDARLASLAGVPETTVPALRKKLGVHPVFKRIDTCAAEFASPTAYMYSTYAPPFGSASVCESRPSARKKIVILGGGPNRIGQGIEFDYCCCHASFALREAGFETIMVNCNPETVSTDYDTSDRLYFEPLTAEDVLEILATEKEAGELKGAIVQFGGQTPLKLAHALEQAGIPILGTSVDSIDLAEDRDRFKRLLDKIGLKQPMNGIAYSVEQSRLIAADLGLPLVVRPSYVLGGRAMAIIFDRAAFDDYLLGTLPGLVPSEIKARYPNDKTGQINTVLGKNPLLFDRYLSDAIEIDVDALSDGKDVFICGIMEHIEEAGIHSGDSACSLPPRSLTKEKIVSPRRSDPEARPGAWRRRLDECAICAEGRRNLCARSQSASGADGAFRRQGDWGADRQNRSKDHGRGKTCRASDCGRRNLDHIGVKELVFPFARFPGVDTVLGPEMRSTGEVMGLDRSFPVAFAKSQLGGGTKVPRTGTVFVSVRDTDKPRVLETARLLATLGFKITATGGTARYLESEGVRALRVNKVSEGRPHVVDLIKNGEIQLVLNTTEGAQALADSRSLRRAALLHKVPYYTTLAGAIAASQGIKAYLAGDLEVRALQDYFV